MDFWNNIFSRNFEIKRSWLREIDKTVILHLRVKYERPLNIGFKKLSRLIKNWEGESIEKYLS